MKKERRNCIYSFCSRKPKYSVSAHACLRSVAHCKAGLPPSLDKSEKPLDPAMWHLVAIPMLRNFRFPMPLKHAIYIVGGGGFFFFFQFKVSKGAVLDPIRVDFL